MAYKTLREKRHLEVGSWKSKAGLRYKTDSGDALNEHMGNKCELYALDKWTSSPMGNLPFLMT